MSPLLTPPITPVTIISPASEEYFSEFQEVVRRVHKEGKRLKLATPRTYETHDRLPLPEGYERSWGTSFETVAILPAGKGKEKEIPVTILLQEASPLTVAEADTEHMSFTLTIDEYDETATEYINGDRQPFEKLVFYPTLRQFSLPEGGKSSKN
jgi:hypothetical protein